MGKQLKYRLVFRNEVPTDMMVRTVAQYELGTVTILDWHEEARFEFDVQLAEGSGTMPQKIYIVALTYEFPGADDTGKHEDVFSFNDLFGSFGDTYDRLFRDFGFGSSDSTDLHQIKAALSRIRLRRKQKQALHEAGRTAKEAIQAGLKAIEEEWGALIQDLTGDDDRKKGK